MTIDSSDEIAEWYAEDNPDGADVLDRLVAWFGRFIAVTDPDDLYILALWAMHTHLVSELNTTPRLLIDSTVFGSGKTTVLEHLAHLCPNSVQAASLSSPALIPRMLESGMRTVLLDEVDRSLRPDKPGVEDMIAILNSGYKFGATRPVLVPVKGGGWEPRDMPTHAPVAMAGNSPYLPADTVSRLLRILLMPDLDDQIEESDWEAITDDATALRDTAARWADNIRADIKGLTVELAQKCIGRSKEKWRPMKRIAVLAGGHWPETTDRLIARNLAEDAAEREAGLKAQPPGMILLTDLHHIWPAGEPGEQLVPTRDLVSRLIAHNPDYWGLGSPYGKALTETRFGMLLSQAAKVTSCRPGGAGPRGYLRSQLAPVWHRLGIARFQPGEPGYAGEPGYDNRVHRVNQPHRVERETPPPLAVTAVTAKKGRPSLCPKCQRVPARSDSGLCDYCTTRQQAVEAAKAQLDGTAS
jgi:hypothetical protein